MSLKQSFDAIVIGAGIAGMASAYYLRKAGLSVLLADAHEPGWGASGRNPGFLWLQTKAAGLAMTFSLQCRAFAETLVEELPDFGFRACGGLIVYRDDEYSPVVDAFVADRNRAGLAVQRVDRHELRDICPHFGPAVSGGVWNRLDAHQDTSQLIVKMREAFATSGGIIRTGVRVVKILTTGEAIHGVCLASGETIGSRVVVVAGGPWSNELLAPLDMALPLQPMRYEGATTAAAPFRIEPVVAGQALFRMFTPPGISKDQLPRHATELFHPGLFFTEQIASFPDGSLQLGCACEMDSSSDLPTVAGQAMTYHILSENIPAIAKLPIMAQRAGVVVQTPDGLPVIDVAGGIDGLVLNTGHFFGNLAGAFSGKLVADAIMASSVAADMAAFGRDRFSGCIDRFPAKWP